MKINESNKSKKEAHEEHIKLNSDTRRTYLQEAGQMTKQRSVSDNQKKQIRDEWDKTSRKKERRQTRNNSVRKKMRNLRSI